jgi:serine/threonine-protein kinase
MLAEDTLLGRLVALKRIHAPDDVAARSRLHREALIGASLGHPNLVSIFDVLTTEDGEEVIVMEYVEGETLAAMLRRGEKPDVSTALAMLDGVSAALDAIHARGIVHRDVKPGNVLLGADGLVKLADLGIAAVPDQTQITTGGAVLGTFRYMSPEQLEGAPATPAVDVYALAAVAFEALSGEKARREPNPLALAHAIATQPPPDLRAVWPEAPAAAAKVLRRGMSRDPKDRPRSAGELTARLRAALEPQPTAAVPVHKRAPARARRAAPVAAASRPRRSRAALLAAAVTVLAAIAVTGIVFANTRTSHQRLASRTVHRSVAAAVRHRSPAVPTRRRKVTRTTARTHASSSARPAAVSPAPTPPTSPAPTLPTTPSPTPPATSVAAGSPIDAVETFYHLAASHDYAAAWNLADNSFRQQLEGYEGLQATMAESRAIIFKGANVVNQSPNSAIVSVSTTSVRESGNQSCSGTVDLLRAATSSPGWLLDHIAISCV